MGSDSLDYVAQQPRLNQRRKLLHPMLRVLVNLLANVEIKGLEHIPVSGPTLLMGNHITIVDPAAITYAVRRRFVVSMAKAETLNNLFERTMLRLWGNFVVNRGEVDRQALNTAINLLKDEHLLWIAPEGTRNPEGMGEARGGTAYIAHKSNAVIVPTAVCGAQDWKSRLRSFRKINIELFFGRPFRFYLPDGERLSRTVREQMIREAMYQLALTIPEAYAFQRGAYRDLENATTQYLQFIHADASDSPSQAANTTVDEKPISRQHAAQK